MTPQQFKELIAELAVLGHELSGIECKGPGARTTKSFLVKVIRAMLGMANRRDGGHIIIGIEDGGDALLPKGLSSGELDSWQYDSLSDSVAEYADPGFSFELQKHDDDSGKKYVLVSVNEFDIIPILCKKTFDPFLRKGACYVRTRRKPETVEIPTQEDMRDLLDLAIEKGLRKFFRQADAAGIPISGVAPPSDQALFDQQVARLL